MTTSPTSYQLTMLSVVPQEAQHRLHQPFYAPYRIMPHRESPPPSLPGIAALGGPLAPLSKGSHNASVAQALEIARESPDGAQDQTVSKILESALSEIWGNVQSQPDSYVMSRDEFAVFNFFQHRFTGDKLAMDARKRYWDNLRA